MMVLGETVVVPLPPERRHLSVYGKTFQSSDDNQVSDAVYDQIIVQMNQMSN